MKNKPQLSELNLAVIRIESVIHLSVHKSTPADSNSESKTAIFRPALIQILNTYIDLAIGRALYRAITTRVTGRFRPAPGIGQGMPR